MSQFRRLRLDSRTLDETNKAFDWRAAAYLPDGRLLGRTTPDKRPNPNDIPDKRIVFLDRLIGLSGKSVLEVGCFEGIHTIGLRMFSGDVTAIDVRPGNVFKTLARLSLHGADAKVFVADCQELDPSFGRFDVVFHIGVLYHLVDPVSHLHAIAPLSDYLYLDTHVAAENERLESYSVGGETYFYRQHGEGGWKDPFSGAQNTSRHLQTDSLLRALKAAGYASSKILQRRAERNGPRLLLIAARNADVSDMPEYSAAALKNAHPSP